MRGSEGAANAGEESTAEVFHEPLANLIADGHRRIDRVEKALADIGLRYRGRTEDRSYRQFITALALANQAARQSLVAIERSGESLPREAYGAARSLMSGFSSKHEKLVESLRPTRAEALEVFAQPFTRLAKKLLPNAEVLFLGWRLSNYEIRVYDQNRAEKFTAGAPISIQREFGEDFQFLQFLHPVLRQADLFQHAAFGHELAHPAIRLRPPDEVIARLGVEGDSPNYANVAVDAAHRAIAAEEISHSTDQQVRLSKWFDEIACDIVGMRLLGPAFGLAFIEVTSVNRGFERNEADSAYPPISMRVDLMEEEFGRFLLPDEFEQRLRPGLDRAFESVVRGVKADDEIPYATEWMQIAVTTFREHCVEALLGGQELAPAALQGDFKAIWDLVGRGIPPAEKITVALEDLPSSQTDLTPWSQEYDWRLILNVMRIGLLDPQANQGGWELSREEASRFATGAIEMAEFHRRARTLRRQYGWLREEGVR
jgi:hypothetical protein